jgi:hypothetical protein
MLKGLIPWLHEQKKQDPEYRRCLVMHLLSAGAGTLVAFLGHIDFFQKLTGAASHDLVWGYIVCGLLSAGGSAFWNHVLDLLKAAKISSESRATKDAKVVQEEHLIPA